MKIKITEILEGGRKLAVSDFPREMTETVDDFNYKPIISIGDSIIVENQSFKIESIAYGPGLPVLIGIDGYVPQDSETFEIMEEEKNVEIAIPRAFTAWTAEEEEEENSKLTGLSAPGPYIYLFGDREEPTGKKVAIVGSRSFDDYETLKAVISNTMSLNNFKIEEIVSGGARGADMLAERYAKDNGIPTRIFPANWKKFGKGAGFMRNVDIINACDICVAFWDGDSRGTKHDIELCRQMGKPCHIFNFRKMEQIEARLKKENEKLF